MSEISKINEILQNYDVAIKYAISASEMDPDNKWYKTDLANLYLLIKDYTKATEVFEELFGLKIDEPPPRVNSLDSVSGKFIQSYFQYLASRKKQ